MYTSTEDARSDLFLSAAVYVVGPVVIELVLGLVPIQRIPGVAILLVLAIPIATTALVPWLLMRYRGEGFGQFGYGAGLPPNVGTGVLLAVPIVVASVLSATATTGQPQAGLAVTALLTDGADGIILLVARLAQWLGLGFLAVYATVKARDAFGSDVRTVRDETIHLGRILAAVGAVAVSLALLFVAPNRSTTILVQLLAMPLGVAGSVGMLLRLLRGPSATTRATLLTPVVLLALGPFQLAFDGSELVLSIWQAALFAGIGLVIGGLLESRRSAVACLALTATIALLTTVLGQ